MAAGEQGTVTNDTNPTNRSRGGASHLAFSSWDGSLPLPEALSAPAARACNYGLNGAAGSQSLAACGGIHSGDTSTKIPGLEGVSGLAWVLGSRGAGECPQLRNALAVSQDHAIGKKPMSCSGTPFIGQRALEPENDEAPCGR